MTGDLELDGVVVPNPDKVLFPGSVRTRVTKGDLTRYYASVAPFLLPVLRGRPISMERCPDGIEGPRFYEKRLPSHFPAFVGRAVVPTAGRVQEQVVVSDVPTLVYLVGQACTTPHAWLTRADRLRQPDQLVVDLDPSVPGVAAVRRATRLIGDILEEVGLEAYLKTTGSRGYHVLVPLRRGPDIDEVRAFARAVAELAVARRPELVTLEQRKEERGRRVLIDIQRNGYAQTMVPAYAVRARPGAPVSAPIRWDELDRMRPDQVTLRGMGARLDRVGDLWAEVGRRPQGLGAARKALRALRTG